MIFTGYDFINCLDTIKDFYFIGKGDAYDLFIEKIINEITV